MSLSERLKDFAGALTSATDGPDDYPDWGHVTYESNMADLKELWSEIRPQLKRDFEKAAWVDAKLQEMFTAFDAGEKDKGRAAVWAIYNSEVKNLQ